MPTNTSNKVSKLVLSRRRISRSPISGKVFPDQERRTYSQLNKLESYAAKSIYSKIRRILSDDKTHFTTSPQPWQKTIIPTVLGKAIVENVKCVRPNEYHGSYNLGILKVSLGKKMMFVKIEDVHKAENRVLGAKLMEAFLKKQGGEVNGFRVKVAPLSVAHDFLLEKLVHTIYATDFYPKKDFEQVENMTDAIGNKANATLKIIRKEIQQRFPKHNIFEINGLNALCNQKTKTLILYDLRAQ